MDGGSRLREGEEGEECVESGGEGVMEFFPFKSVIFTPWEEGRCGGRGREEGREEGRKGGREEGKKRGRKEGRKKVNFIPVQRPHSIINETVS